MKFYIRISTINGVRNRHCPDHISPRASFKRCVKWEMKVGSYAHIELIRQHCGNVKVLESWSSAGYMAAPVPYKYKVHSARSPLGTTKSSSSDKYYDTLEEAQAQAERCVQSRRADHEGFIIYKAVKRVQRAQAPVTVEDIE